MIDSRKISLSVVALMGALAVAFFAGRGMWGPAWMVVSIFAIGFFVNTDNLIFIVFLAYFFHVKSHLPGGIPMLYPWIMTLYCVMKIIGASISRGEFFEKPLSLKRAVAFLILFSVSLMVVMAVRGSGIYLLGGKSVGGSRYLVMLTSIVFTLLSVNWNPPDRMKTKLFNVFLISSFFLFFCQVLAVKGVTGIERFIKFDTSNLAGAILGDTDRVSRYQTLSLVSFSLLGFSALLWNRKKKVLYVVCVFFALLAALWCGFRRVLLGFFVINFLFHFFYAKSKTKAVLISASCLAVGVCVAYALAPILPDSMQRGLAVLPGVNIAADTAMVAAHSSRWRIEIWQHCLSELPPYLLVGKGALLTLTETFEVIRSASSIGATPLYAYMNHSYHSFLMALLLDIGLFGTVSYFAAMVYFGLFIFKRGRLLRGEEFARFCFIFSLWINRQLHQLYTTGLTWRVVENLLWLVLLFCFSSAGPSSEVSISSREGRPKG